MIRGLCIAALLSGLTIESAEIRHVYSPAEGLPSIDVRCVAAAGNRVWAGTGSGLAYFSSGSWHGEKRFPLAVAACAADGDALWFASGGALHRWTDAGVKREIALPGDVQAIAAARGDVWIGTAEGVYQLRSGRAVRAPLPVARVSVRQIAVNASGEAAVAAGEGLFVLESGEWKRQFPRQGERSWAPVDVRGVAYDARGRLWFASPQGAGCRNAGTWKLYTGLEGLPYDDFTTMTAGEDGVVWFGTKLGAIRYDGRSWEYRQGLRWLPDDGVRAIAVAGANAWFATAKGVGRIERKPMTLAEKARFFESEIDKRHRRTEYEYVMSVRLPQAGDTSEWIQSDSDNDGLWTSMYGAGECFAWAATHDAAARKRARKAFEALRFLSLVTQGGEHPAPPGFPARAILPTSGPDPNVHDSPDRDKRTRAQRDHLWKVLSPRWPKSADGKWYWKTDTSSDELDGHYFFYARYYDLVADTEQEKDEVRAVVRAITDHLLEHNYSLVDWDGTPTRWAIFDPHSLNDNHIYWAERGLNSLSILSYLKVAWHVTRDAKYQDAYVGLVRDHKYASNAMVPKIAAGPGSGNQSDDEMAFMGFYDLLKYETDAELTQKYALALANYWALERPELNPLFNFIAAASLEGKTFTSAFRTEDLSAKGDWKADSIDTLERLPLDRIDWRHTNSKRKDIVHLRSYLGDDSEEMAGTGMRRNGKAIPVDERFFSFWNHNPYRLDSGGSGHTLADGAVFLLPYYMGLYHHYIQE